MVPTLKKYPKLEQRFFDGIWLGRDESTGEHILGISNRVIRARTVRRTIAPHKYNQQLMDVVNAGPWHIPPPTAPIATRVARPTRETGTDTSRTSAQDAGTSTTNEHKRAPQQDGSPRKQQRLLPGDAGPTSPMATSPTTSRRPPLPPPTRTRADEIAEGSTSKQQKTGSSATAEGKARANRATENEAQDWSHHSKQQNRTTNRSNILRGSTGSRK